MEVDNINVMANKTEEAHLKEWKKISNEYKEQAKVKDPSDSLYYRHKCIEGLITGETWGYRVLSDTPPENI